MTTLPENVITEPSDVFVEFLRRHLPLLEPGAELGSTTPLGTYGLDSLASIALMMEIEDTFDVTFPDELMTGQTFETLTSLWEAVGTLLSAR